MRSESPPPSSFPLHQIWLQGEERLPSKYLPSVNAYRSMTSGYRLWSYRQIVDLMQTEEYRWLLSTFNAYGHWVMRVDLAKYVILHRYGGFYVDMDTTVRASFEPLTSERSKVIIERVTDDAILKHLLWLWTFVNNHFFWVPYPNHPFMTATLHLASRLATRMPYEFLTWYILDSTGPNLIYTVMEAHPGLVKLMDSQELRKYFVHDNHRTWISVDTQDKIIAAVGLLFIALLIRALLWRRTSKPV